MKQAINGTGSCNSGDPAPPKRKYTMRYNNHNHMQVSGALTLITGMQRHLKVFLQQSKLFLRISRLSLRSNNSDCVTVLLIALRRLTASRYGIANCVTRLPIALRCLTNPRYAVTNCVTECSIALRRLTGNNLIVVHQYFQKFSA